MSELLTAANPDAVADIYRGLWTGHIPNINDPSAFFAVTLSGAQGRAVVRDWFETTVGKVIDNLARHFGDLAIVRNTPPPRQRPLPPILPLPVLLRSLAPMGDEKGIPDPLAAQFIRAALQGRPYPYAILQRALERTRAEIGRSDWADLERRDARAALIKAVLLRRTENRIGVTMNPQSTGEGYNLGCLMAVLERLQEAALESVNASVIDRYFGAASATPRSVFVRLLRNAQHHARKARDSERNAGLSFLLKNLVDEFVDRFHIDTKKPGYASAEGIPAFLPLEQQGLFVVGYHQMRKWLWMTKDERSAWIKEYPEAPRAFQWGSKDVPQPVEA
jgi:CRISPR-associated protein Csd1